MYQLGGGTITPAYPRVYFYVGDSLGGNTLTIRPGTTLCRDELAGGRAGARGGVIGYAIYGC